jgi:hypothetical protein
MKTRLLRCSEAKWHGREAFVLANDLVHLVTLVGGGHIAEFRFREATGSSVLNPLWVPPWKTIEPYRYRARQHSRCYGSPATGRMLSGITGHNLCLDFFGSPSEEEARQGLSIHGEAPSLRWRKADADVRRQEVRLKLAVRLPVAQLRFERELTLRQGEAVAYFRETVKNERKIDHFFHWTQHVTLGPPFLEAQASSVWIPALRGRTYPHGYEGKELLESSRDFKWPRAPGVGRKVVDLTQPFIRRGKGFVATALLNPAREIGYIAAVNREARLLFGYCFRRSDFPWVVTWEENRTRGYPPWNGRCQARGLEFGSTPFPLPRREAFAHGPLFATPHFSMVPARGSRAVDYLCFLAVVPRDFADLRELRVTHDEILLSDARGRDRVRVRASGLVAMNLARKV